MELLQCVNINKSFGKKKILEDINLTVPRGKIIGLLGKNGTGKSTLIKIINDLLTVDSGEVLINGEKIGIASKNIISYLPERTYLDKSMTVDKVIEFFQIIFTKENRHNQVVVPFNVLVNKNITKTFLIFVRILLLKRAIL